MIRRVLMIAGPNGAGKTTMAQTLIPNRLELYEFVNADEIAKGLSPLHPESMVLPASKLMIKRLRELLASSKSFAFETTAAGTNYVKYLKEARAKGYEINLMYLWLSGPDQAIKRVQERVRQKGHNIPREVIHRRYFLGLKNLFKYYLPLADSFIILDNSLEKITRFIARKDLGRRLEIVDEENWKKMQRIADV